MRVLIKHRGLVDHRTRRTPMAEKKSQTEGKEVAEVSDDELKALMNQNAKLQEKENDGDSV